MSMWNTVPVLDTIGHADFYGDFVAKRRPVVMRGLTSGWKARDWDLERFRQLPSSAKLGVKTGTVADGRRVSMTIADYAGLLQRYEASLAAGQPLDSPGYLHDVPIFRFFPELADEAAPFPLPMLPRWYHRTWQEYAQFFMGPTGSSTPLHFDTLLTHNIFFHLAGRKRFVLIPAEQRRLCYPKSWRWMSFDPIRPDVETFPLAEQVKPVTVDLEPGDTLYMPSGTLHQVTNQTMTISFNIDWHTADSARDGMVSVVKGAPWKNGYYNALSWLGVGARVPAKYIFPFYKSYLTYVS
ncbi:cupin-like domain-containing protein [Micromonospora sp. NPDC047467]|uniref:cupin-like domain-containing protein n=1 Tax=Micromonospora sp. NPDC047467 TaxID=3154814 RepID=UPI0033ED03BE